MGFEIHKDVLPAIYVFVNWKSCPNMLIFLLLRDEKNKQFELCCILKDEVTKDRQDIVLRIYPFEDFEIAKNHMLSQADELAKKISDAIGRDAMVRVLEIPLDADLEECTRIMKESDMFWMSKPVENGNIDAALGDIAMQKNAANESEGKVH